VQNASARLLKGVRKCDPITPILLDLHWPLVAFRIDFKIALLTYCCLNRLAPRYLQMLLCRPFFSRLARDRLISMNPRTMTYGSRSFKVYAPQLWNSLLQSVHVSSSLAQFRSHLKTHLFSVALRDEIDRRAPRERKRL
jgi:hypothetical protein